MLRELTHAAHIYTKLQLVHLRIFFEYEADFWIGILATMLRHGTGLVFVWVVFQRVPEVAGWGVWEIAFLYSLAIIPRGLTEVLCDGQWSLRLLVNRGEFDWLLVRPISPALQLITQRLSIEGIGSAVLGLVVLAIALGELDLSWGVSQHGFLLLTIISSVVLIGSINYATNCIAFWEPAMDGPVPFLVQNMLELAKFPITLYGRLIQAVLTWVLPFAFVSYYPGIVLLGKSAPHQGLAYASPVAGLAAGLVASVIWRWGLTRYQGVGH